MAVEKLLPLSACLLLFLFGDASNVLSYDVSDGKSEGADAIEVTKAAFESRLTEYRHELIFLLAILVVLALLVAVWFFVLRRSLQVTSAGLLRSEKEYRLLFDEAPVPYQSLDEAGCILNVNRAWLDLLGYQKNDVIGRPFSSFLHPDETEAFNTHFSVFLNSDCSRAENMRLLSRSGKVLNCLAEGKVKRSKEGIFEGTVCALIDKTAEVEAELLRKQLIQCVEQSRDAVYITNQAGDIEYVNAAFAKLTGYCPEEILGKNPRLLKGGTQEASFYVEMWKSIKETGGWHGKVINRKKDGSLYPAYLTISAVQDDSGVVVNYIATQQDITDLEVLDESLRQMQKMEAIGTLAGGIAHDFNNALAGIMGNVYLVKKEPNMMGVQRQRLDAIERTSLRSAEIIKQLLTFAGKRSGKKMQDFDLLPLLEGVVLAKEAALAGVHVEKNLAVSVVPLYGDKVQLQQALTHVLGNAVDALRGNQAPRLILGLRVCRDEDFFKKHAEYRGRDVVHLSVADNGSGIDARHLPHVFEPFYTTKEVGQGAGLGLSMAYGVVTEFGGAIELESEPARGTTVHIYLPLAPEGELTGRQSNWSI